MATRVTKKKSAKGTGPQAPDERVEGVRLLSRDIELRPIAEEIEASWEGMLRSVVGYGLLCLRPSNELVRDRKVAVDEDLVRRATRLRELVRAARVSGAPPRPGIDAPLVHTLRLLEETGDLAQPLRVGDRRWGPPHVVVWDAIVLVLNFAQASMVSDDVAELLCVSPSHKQRDDPMSARWFRASGVIFRGGQIRRWIRQYAVQRRTGGTAETAEAFWQLIQLSRVFNDFKLTATDVTRRLGMSTPAPGKGRVAPRDRSTIEKWALGDSRPRGWRLGDAFLRFLLERKRGLYSRRRVHFLRSLLQQSDVELDHIQLALERLGPFSSQV